MGEILASIVKTTLVSEAAKHPEEALDIASDIVCGACECAGDILEGAGDCLCGLIDGIGSLFD